MKPAINVSNGFSKEEIAEVSFQMTITDEDAGIPAGPSSLLLDTTFEAGIV